MKTSSKNAAFRKLSLLIAFAGALTLTSCKKESAEAAYLTQEEAAEVMSESVTDNNSGVAAYAEGHAWLNVSGSDSTECLLNETFLQTGLFVSKLQRKVTFTKKNTITLVKLTVDRTTRKIKSGVAEIAVRGTTATGATIVHNGTVTFKGNNSAVLVIKNGQTINLQW